MKTIPEKLAERLRTHADTFLQQGDQARLDDLAAELGIARATLYYYFSGRDDLTTFFMNDKIAGMGRAIRETSDTTLPPLTQLERALRSILAILCDAPMVCLHLSAAQSRPGALQDMADAMAEQVIAPLQSILDTAGNDGSLRYRLRRHHDFVHPRRRHPGAHSSPPGRRHTSRHRTTQSSTSP